jgi:branched-chain amino acid transport system substrate-binding protein
VPEERAVPGRTAIVGGRQGAQDGTARTVLARAVAQRELIPVPTHSATGGSLDEEQRIGLAKNYEETEVISGIQRYTKHLALAALFAAGAASAENIRIAFIDPMSGSLAASGQSALKQFHTMAEFANRGKWAGDNTLEFTGFDSKGSPQEALAQFKLAVDQGYRYITQGAGSGVALALMDAVNKHNERNPGKEVMFLNFAAADPDMTNTRCSFWHFRFDANSDMKVEALTDYIARDPSVKKVYLIHQNYAAGLQFRRAAKEYLGRKRPDIQIVGDDLHPIGQVKDFAPYVAKMKAAGADTVITQNWGADAALLIRAIRDSGLAVNIYAPYATTPGVATAMGESGLNRVKGMAAWHANNETLAGSDIVEFHKRKYHEDVAIPGILAEVQLFSQALRQAASTSPVRVAYAMEGLKMKGLNGEIEMRKADHQLQQPLYIMSWAKINGQDLRYDQENTGYGWKTVKKIDASVAAQPTSCQMKRPGV